MGCHGSKSTATSSQMGSLRHHQHQNGNAETTGPVIEDGYLNVDDAELYVQQKLGVHAGYAVRMVNKIDKTNDGKVSHEELSKLVQSTKEVKDKLEPRFLDNDKQRTGFVTPEDAVAIMSKELPDLPEANMAAVVKRFDRDGNNKVDFEEFMDFYAHIRAKKEYLEQKFAELDSDKSDDLDPEELLQVVIQSCGIEEFQARSLIADFDLDKDGKIDKGEFINMWTRLFG